MVLPERGSYSNPATSSAIRSQNSEACAFEIRACRTKPHSFGGPSLGLDPGEPEGTLREHHRGHKGARAVTCLRAIPSSCVAFVPAACRCCSRSPPRRSMVRRGSTVRVRQRPSRKCLQIGHYACPTCKRPSRAGTCGHSLVFPRLDAPARRVGLSKPIRTRLTPSVPLFRLDGAPSSWTGENGLAENWRSRASH
jgi:hypothetical protein